MKKHPKLGHHVNLSCETKPYFRRVLFVERWVPASLACFPYFEKKKGK
jgi:hypothetical protein